MARVLITGGTGFVGSHAVEAFLREGWQVRALVRNPQLLGWLSGLPIEIAHGTLIDTKSLKEAVTTCDVVIHCAGLTKAINPSDYFRINAVAVGDLVNAARIQGVRRFVLCSSQAAVGPSTNQRPSVESDPPHPISHYGRSKLEGENCLRESARDMKWVILRPPSVMGARDRQFIPLFRAVAHYGIYPTFGSSEKTYSLIGVHDLVRSILLSATASNGLNDTYFVANPVPITWKYAAEKIGEMADKRIHGIKLNRLMLQFLSIFAEIMGSVRGKPPLLGRDKTREITAGGYVCSPDKIHRTWGFECTQSLDDVLRNTYDAYRSAKWL